MTILYDEPRVLLILHSHRLAGKESVTLDDIAVEPIPRLPDADWNACWRIYPRPAEPAASGGPLVNAVEDKLELSAAGQAVVIVSAGLRADSLHPDLTTIPLHGVELSRVVLATRTCDRSRLVAAWPEVIPSRHEDVWDYGGAAGTGPGPGQSVLR